MRHIALPNGKSCIVDDEDYAALSKYKWHLAAGAPSRWLKRKNGKQERVIMHRQILQAPDGVWVDHKNGVRTDNRKSNLRFCNRAQNSWNQGKPQEQHERLQGRPLLQETQAVRGLHLRTL